jgi:hypothetical protein
MANFLECYISEANKLEGQSNYNVWKFKIFFILIREDLWDIVEPQVVQASFFQRLETRLEVQCLESHHQHHQH